MGSRGTEQNRADRHWPPETGNHPYIDTSIHLDERFARNRVFRVKNIG